MSYIIALFLMIVLYAFGIYLTKYIKNVRIWNYLFSSVVFILYVSLVSTVYADVGPYDWNFQNTLPVANVSPFMFSIVFIIQLLPSKIRKHFYLLVSLLCVGMFLSTVLNCIYNAVIHYRFIKHFLLDYFAHFILSLWGIYLVKTKQVELTKKNVLISSSIIVGVAAIMVVINLIFDTSFFGLSLRGKHNIYNNVLVDNSYLSALIYFVGLIGLLVLGYFVCSFVNKRVQNNEKITEDRNKILI